MDRLGNGVLPRSLEQSFYSTVQSGYISILRELLLAVLFRLFCSFRVLTFLSSAFVMERVI